MVIYVLLLQVSYENTDVQYYFGKLKEMLNRDFNSCIRIRYFDPSGTMVKIYNPFYILTHRAEPFLRSCQMCSHSRISRHFMEPKGSLPCSQEPSTGPYPKPDQSNPYHSISLRSILILSTFVSYLLAFPPISYMHSASPPFMLHALPISSSLTWSV
jgi:hypothetical protein